VAGFSRRAHRREGRASRPIRAALHAQTGTGAQRRDPHLAQHPLREHDRGARGALLPRRRAHGAPVPPLDPLERGRHGDPRAAAGSRGGRAHLVLRLRRHAVRGRLQPLLPRQAPPRRRRPGVLPGPRGSRQLRPRVHRGAPLRGRHGRLPPGVLPAGRRSWPALLPAPPPHGGLLGVPHGLHGPRPGARHLPGLGEQVPARPRYQGHLPAERVGVPRRRRDGRARVARHAAARRPAGPRQPHLRGQLQPAAPRRPRPWQRQDHPGARGVLPGCRLERHQGHLGPRVGPAAQRGQGSGARQPDEQHARRRLPDLQGERRRLRAGELLRP